MRAQHVRSINAARQGGFERAFALAKQVAQARVDDLHERQLHTVKGLQEQARARMPRRVSACGMWGMPSARGQPWGFAEVCSAFSTLLLETVKQASAPSAVNQ